MASGRKEVILQLKPESLGEVRAQLSASGRHGVTVRLETVTEQAREALLQDVDALRRSIESQGVRVDRIQVACHSRAVSASADGQGARFDFGQSGQSGQWTSQGQSAQSSLSDGSGGAHGGRRDEAFSAAWQQQSQQQGHGGSRQHDARAFHGNARPDAPSRSEATHAAERFLGDGRRDADPLAATRVSGRVSVLA